MVAPIGRSRADSCRHLKLSLLDPIKYATTFIERQELALRSMASFTPVLSSGQLSRAKAPHAHATLKKILMASTTPAEPLAAAQTILTEVCARLPPLFLITGYDALHGGDFVNDPGFNDLDLAPPAQLRPTHNGI